MQQYRCIIDYQKMQELLLVFQNRQIKIKQKDGLYCLNDLHRAYTNGQSRAKKPDDWIKRNVDLSVDRSRQLSTNEIELKIVRGSGTYSNLNGVYAYARWLHADLYAAVLEALDTDVDVVIVRDRNEIKFGSSIIANMFSAYTIIPQYPVLGYRIDWYIPELNLAIEYDELHHSTPANTAADAERQAAIEKELGCKFIRYKEKPRT